MITIKCSTEDEMKCFCKAIESTTNCELCRGLSVTCMCRTCKDECTLECSKIKCGTHIINNIRIEVKKDA